MELEKRPGSIGRSRLISRNPRPWPDAYIDGDSGSVKVCCGQPASAQRKRRMRTCNSITRPWAGKSSTRRRCRLWTRSEQAPQLGQQLTRPSRRASMVIVSDLTATASRRRRGGRRERRSRLDIADAFKMGQSPSTPLSTQRATEPLLGADRGSRSNADRYASLPSRTRLR